MKLARRIIFQASSARQGSPDTWPARSQFFIQQRGREFLLGARPVCREYVKPVRERNEDDGTSNESRDKAMLLYYIHDHLQLRAPWTWTSETSCKTTSLSSLFLPNLPSIFSIILGSLILPKTQPAEPLRRRRTPQAQDAEWLAPTPPLPTFWAPTGELSYFLEALVFTSMMPSSQD